MVKPPDWTGPYRMCDACQAPLTGGAFSRTKRGVLCIDCDRVATLIEGDEGRAIVVANFVLNRPRVGFPDAG